MRVGRRDFFPYTFAFSLVLSFLIKLHVREIATDVSENRHRWHLADIFLAQETRFEMKDKHSNSAGNQVTNTR